MLSAHTFEMGVGLQLDLTATAPLATLFPNLIRINLHDSPAAPDLFITQWQLFGQPPPAQAHTMPPGADAPPSGPGLTDCRVAVLPGVRELRGSCRWICPQAVQACPGMRRLHLTVDGPGLTPDSVQLIPRWSLTHLHLVSPLLLSGADIHDLLSHLKHLRELHAEGWKELDDPCLSTLASSAPLLRRLRLLRCPSITAAGLAMMLTINGRGMEVLEVTGCEAVKREQAKALQDLVSEPGSGCLTVYWGHGQ